MKKVVVLGVNGFIGGHLVYRLKEEGYWVKGVDIKENEFRKSCADEFVIGDLRNPFEVDKVIDNSIDEVYISWPADMGGSTCI